MRDSFRGKTAKPCPYCNGRGYVHNKNNPVEITHLNFCYECNGSGKVLT